MQSVMLFNGWVLVYVGDRKCYRKLYCLYCSCWQVGKFVFVEVLEGKGENVW